MELIFANMSDLSTLQLSSQSAVHTIECMTEQFLNSTQTAFHAWKTMEIRLTR